MSKDRHISEKETPELTLAKLYWKQELANERRITESMHPGCKISIVIPVFREHIDRIAKQIQSFQHQKGISLDEFEVLYVINNDLPGTSKEQRAAQTMNATLIASLPKPSGMHIYVIDKSSPGNEMPNCNVGKARNRGVAEASLRFYENQKNGIIIQTDADTWLDDDLFLATVEERMDEDASIIGIAGGIIWNWSPDTQDLIERRILRRKLDQFTLQKTYNSMTRFLANPHDPLLAGETRFSGACMISRSLETAIVGGIPTLATAEDQKFGQNLGEYAVAHGKKIVGEKSRLRFVAAVRESNRTPASFGALFNAINPDISSQVIDIFSENPTVVTELTEKYIQRLKDEVRKRPNGNAFVDNWERQLAERQL